MRTAKRSATMFKKLTTPQLAALAQQIIDRRLPPLEERDAPSALIPPQLLGCDGPSRTLELAYETKSWMRNPADILHGGITATLLDSSMGVACLCFSGVDFAPTVSMNLQYLRPAPLNATVAVRARVVSLGRTLSHTTAELYLPHAPEQILACASGVYYTAGDSSLKPRQDNREA
ncbi:MAG TPA: hypothetical protein DIT49_02610 [Clostridiales bacterium]|nr:hypothetical protein [Clostridiales bacterium]